MLGRILATEGGNATLPCDPEAAPKATIRWLRNGAVSYCQLLALSVESAGCHCMTVST